MSALAGKLREVTGKSAIRKIRNDETMPAVMYGLKDNINLTVNPKELKKLLLENGRNALIELNIDGDASRSVVLKEYQAHPIKAAWLHADFLEVDITKKIRVKVPVILVGVAPGEKMGGIVNHIMRQLEVESIPKNIPEKIEVPMGELQLNQVIHVSDLVVGENVDIINPLGEAVVTVHEEKVKEEKPEGEEGELGEEAEAAAAAPADAAAKKEDG
ncbi:MAG: 50S ribosomal protein L25 [Nitrospina sp.]|jgi:large subunit ribosomal protein L25|nr:50S ribosomal protein L25 [Nitrospina sp.]MBT3874684.1 50S ribosomal protein L25 [Nitrospina sp.]MBT4049418.1 50S ribosomal protein L25 [Nitrospina sp.]MBT4556287.1 50S ribosomal protein L25 [Nitrospina sp.]MBT5348957.1 50S ribosomal protein L25 [Nitrospina sp.]